MGNNIALAKVYTNLLDEVYQQSALTANLESDATLARAGANANEIVIPKLSMDGLADYNRNSGYVDGDVELTWETAKFNYERGRSFTVDDMDNEETQNIAFGRLAGEFIRTKVVPELDAFRFATYAGTKDAGTATGTLSDGAGVIAALRAATSAMDEAEVPMEDRHLYITPTLYGLVQDLDTTKSREVLGRFASITQVPQTRFYSAIDLQDGKTEGEEKGGFKKADHKQEYTATASQTEFIVTAKPASVQKVTVEGASVEFTYDAATGKVTLSAGASVNNKVVVIYDTGVKLNFEIIHKPAVLQFTKHAVPKIIAPEQNQNADAWKYGYRNYGLCDTYENKAAGIYVHKKAL